MTGWRNNALTVVLAAACGVGLVFSARATARATEGRDEQTADLHLFAGLREHLAGVPQADLLLDGPRTRPRRGARGLKGRRFRVQYVVTPTVVDLAESLEDAVARARGRPVYHLIRDPACDWTLEEVRAALHPVARASGRRVEVRETASGASVVTLTAERAP